MAQSKPTLTVAIPAYNEEANIAGILRAVIRQKSLKVDLKEIVVYSDASTDSTDSLVRAFSKKFPIVRLIRKTQRKGKYFRIGQIFKDCLSDVLIVLDADIDLVGNDFLNTLSTVILSDSKAQMVVAHNKIIRPKGFMPRVIFSHFMIWDSIRYSIPNYDSGVNFYGTATAFRGSYARSFRFPVAIKDPHLFMYLKAKKVNGFRYCREAEVLQWTVSTFEDLKKIRSRTLGKRDVVLEKMFGEDIYNASDVPMRAKFVGLFKAVAASPFYTLLGVALTIYINRLHMDGVNSSAVWDIVESTKRPIH